jgi:hypothetical protein
VNNEPDPGPGLGWFYALLVAIVMIGGAELLLALTR